MPYRIMYVCLCLDKNGSVIGLFVSIISILSLLSICLFACMIGGVGCSVCSGMLIITYSIVVLSLLTSLFMSCGAPGFAHLWSKPPEAMT